MKFLKIDLETYTKEEIDFIAGEILAGKVVVLPTDTIYGLSAIATSQRAVDKIYAIKKRKSEDQKLLVLLVKSFCMIRRYCFLSKKQYDYLKEKWNENERALTVVLRSRENLINDKNERIREIVSEDNGISVRLPDNKFLLDLIKKVDEPIISTSLNITGEEDLKNVSVTDEYFKDIKPDLVVDAGILPERQPSRLEDLRDMKDIRIYRE